MNDFFDYFKSNPNHLANIVGMQPQSIYDVVNIKKANVGISKRLAKKIAENFPVNESYFLTGDGDMLKSKDTPTNKGHIEVSKEAWELINLQAKTLDRQAQSLDKRDRQIDELISLLTIQISDNKKTVTAAGA